MISDRATSLVYSPAVPLGGRPVSGFATLHAVIGTQANRDQIAAQLWGRGYPKVCLSGSNIKSWAMAPEPRRQS
jgi:hypothetical protein